ILRRRRESPRPRQHARASRRRRNRRGYRPQLVRAQRVVPPHVLRRRERLPVDRPRELQPHGAGVLPPDRQPARRGRPDPAARAAGPHGQAPARSDAAQRESGGLPGVGGEPEPGRRVRAAQGRRLLQRPVHLAQQEPVMRSRGFTLIELSVVFSIVALLLGGLMYTLSAQTEQRDFEETRRRLDRARELVLSYAIVNGKLPCPATAT